MHLLRISNATLVIAIEVYHKELKQTCGIAYCQARSGRAQRNHFLLSMLAWIDLKFKRCVDTLSIYRSKWQSIKQSISLNLSNFYATP